jgi:hypothetical protein
LNLHRIPRIACLGFLCGIIVCGCGAGANFAPTTSKSSRDAKMQEAKGFDAFRIYYAGEKVAGLLLMGISEASHGRFGNDWNFSYGNCELPSGLFAEGGCSLPLSVQNWSTCARWANMFTRSRDPHGLFDLRRAKAAPNRRLFDFRGAKATRGEGGSELEIFTGRTTVVIWVHRRNVANSAAQQLRDVRQARPAPLPPPVSGALQGKLPCQG